MFLVVTAIPTTSVVGQDEPLLYGQKHRVGERLSYNISFENLLSAGNAELFTASKGKLSGRPAIEIRSRIRTANLMSAAFLLLDESRTVYVAQDSGLPLFVSTIDNDGALPKETTFNFLTQPTLNFDLISLLYKVREIGGAGTFTFFEGEQTYSMTLQPAGTVLIKTDAGNFETNIINIQSEFFTVKGLKDVKLNLSTDEDRVPVSFSFRAARGLFRATLVARTVAEPDQPDPVSTPIPTPTPVVVATPRPSPTPEPYLNDRPLLPELGFSIGEIQYFRVSTEGKYLGTIQLAVKERRQFQDQDSLHLTATVVDAAPANGILNMSDSLSVQSDPIRLTPRRVESKFASAVPALNQTVTFDERTGQITFGGDLKVDAPIGTHSILTLIYAMRSFNLRHSKDLTNPVNDTRVAVFWDSRAHIFTLRPSDPTEIEMNGEKYNAQLISVTTGNQFLDSLAPKVWLNVDTRVPLRVSLGAYLFESTPTAYLNEP